MIQFLKDKVVTTHFDKVLLAFLFLATIILAIHLMHKSDAGGDDGNFIVWAETQAAMVLGALLGLIKGEKTPPPLPFDERPKTIEQEVK